jgi:predicted signal transduction protein with EAL and GGDEF domain
VSVYPDHGADPETLIQRAELAANAAKVLPYGVQLFHPALESRAVRRLGIAADLRKALDNDELDVYYQPKVTLADRHLVGVECLARWTHAAHGEVAPEDFVAVAEHTGQLSRLTERVLTEGLRRCREWAEADRPLSIAVNLSVRTLLDSRFPDLVAEQLERYGVAAAQVTFEISEPGMLGDIERVLPTLYRLRDLGVPAQRRRLRHGRVLAVVPAAVAGARGQDRRQLRAGDGDRLRRPGDRAGRWSACPVSSVSPWWPRGSRAS